MSDYQSKLRIDRVFVARIRAHQDAIDELRKLIRNTGYSGMVQHYADAIKVHQAEIIRLRKPG